MQDMYKEEIQRLKSKRMKEEEQLTKAEREKIKQLEETLSKMVEDKVCNSAIHVLSIIISSEFLKHFHC